MNFGFKRKRGNAVLDVILIIIVLFTLGLIIVIGNDAFVPLYGDVVNDTTFSNESQTVAQDHLNTDTSLWDNIFIMVFVLLWIGALLASFMIDSHPIFFVLTLILLIGVIIAAGILANAYEELGEDSLINASSYPKTTFILTNLLTFVIAIGLSIGLVLFAKNR